MPAAAVDSSSVRAHKRVSALLTQLSTPTAAAAPATAATITTASVVTPTPCDAKSESILSSLENVRVERRGRVGIVTMYRPAALNALSDGLIADIVRSFYLSLRALLCSALLRVGSFSLVDVVLRGCWCVYVCGAEYGIHGTSIRSFNRLFNLNRSRSCIRRRCGHQRNVHLILP